MYLLWIISNFSQKFLDFDSEFTGSNESFPLRIQCKFFNSMHGIISEKLEMQISVCALTSIA